MSIKLLGSTFFSAVLAEMEREVQRDRVKAGMARAAERGVKFGPRFKLSDAQMEQLVHLHRAGASWRELKETFGISHGTVKSYLDRWETKENNE